MTDLNPEPVENPLFTQMLGRANRPDPEPEDFQERGTPDQLAALYGALANAQGSFKDIVKDRHVKIQKKDGGSYEYDYAPLCNVIDATRIALSANGLAVLQPPTRMLKDDDKAVVRTILAHSSGARLVFTMEVRGEGDIKDFGGRITYARRYQLQAVLGVDAGEADDDAAPTRAGESGATVQQKNRQPPTSAPRDAKPPSRPQPDRTPKPAPQATMAPPMTPAQMEAKLTANSAPPAQPGDPGPEPPPEVVAEPVVETDDIPESVRALDDAALALAIRNAAIALKHSRASAQERCLAVTGKPREECQRADLEKLLVAFNADMGAAA